MASRSSAIPNRKRLRAIRWFVMPGSPSRGWLLSRSRSQTMRQALVKVQYDTMPFVVDRSAARSRRCSDGLPWTGRCGRQRRWRRRPERRSAEGQCARPAAARRSAIPRRVSPKPTWLLRASTSPRCRRTPRLKRMASWWTGSRKRLPSTRRHRARRAFATSLPTSSSCPRARFASSPSSWAAASARSSARATKAWWQRTCRARQMLRSS